MNVMTAEVVELTADEAMAAARSALARRGFTFSQLEDQWRRNDFESLNARRTWEAVRYVGDPERA